MGSRGNYRLGQYGSWRVLEVEEGSGQMRTVLKMGGETSWKMTRQTLTVFLVPLFI